MYPFLQIIILYLGTRIDLRKDIHTREPEKLVTTEEGMQLKETIKAYSFVECSALTNVNVKHVFDEAVRAANKKRSRNENCRIM